MASVQTPSDYAAATAYLRALKRRGVTLGLERMQRFLAVLGHPERAVPCIHIAGTNGKGSVAAMLEGILRTAGWKTGLYTSPHLVKLGERVQVNRENCSEDELAAAVRELQPLAEGMASGQGAFEAPTYFEFMTALAFRRFVALRCDIAVVETGLGGRLDATNVVVPEVSVITSIGLDHCDVLGDTLSGIAAEKAGIIKPGRPVVLGRLPAEAEAVIRSTAEARGARVISVEEEFGRELGSYPRTNLAGDYQRWNAATATLVARTLDSRWRISDAVIARGLANVTWPGRWERLAVEARTVIIDTTHNPEGAGVLDANLQQLASENGSAPIVVVGVLGASRAAAILPVVARHAREIHLVMPAQDRACTFEEMRALLPNFRGAVIADRLGHIFPAPGRCTLGAAADTIVVTGSIYLAGEALARLDPARPASENDLQDF